MKKTVFSVMFAIMFGMALSSCGNGATGTTTDVDSLAVDTTVVETMSVDSVATEAVAMDSVVVEEAEVVE